MRGKVAPAPVIAALAVPTPSTAPTATPAIAALRKIPFT
jgi:hypothetical protein